jgi:ABC-type protease/lipase transport system fused ATPase/permease subunit
VNNTIKPKELTIRGLILGALITTIFTAANVYLGLKVGLTFASSIPAAVISMAILSVVKDSSILENNIVQTVASAAGTLGHHLRVAGTRDRRLVDRVSVLAIVSHLPERWRAWCVVYDSSSSRARNKLRPSLPRRCCRR